MPPLLRPREPGTITLAPRTATVAAECDVLVVGGGPAGLGAALGAADTGADVILVERHAFLGGNATAALVMPLMSFHTQRGPATPGSASELMPHDHGPGDPSVAPFEDLSVLIDEEVVADVTPAVDEDVEVVISSST